MHIKDDICVGGLLGQGQQEQQQEQEHVFQSNQLEYNR